MSDAQTRVQLRQTLFLMASVRLIALLILTLTNAAEDTSLTPQQHDCGGLRGDGSCAATTTSVCRNSRGGNQFRAPHAIDATLSPYTGGVQNFASAAGRVRRCSKIEGDLLIDHVELASLPFLTEVTGSIYIGSQPQYDGGNLHTLRREQPCLARSTKLEAVSLDALLVVRRRRRRRRRGRRRGGDRAGAAAGAAGGLGEASFGLRLTH